jgi:DNA-binding LacI/PurR family transcriptional regulator
MNLDEVAKRAGVSAATVSRVLNNLNVVRDSTRDRVMRAVSDLNYHPNLHARSLAGGKNRTIGMIASNLENPFFFDIFRTLEEDAHTSSYEVLVAHTGYSPEQLVRSVRTMIGRRVAGLAVIVSEMAPDLMEELELSRIPAVFYDVGAAKRHISNIRVQYRHGIERLVEHLHGLGHKRFAFIGHHSTLGPTSEREQAFVETMARVQPVPEWRTAADQDGPEGGRRAIGELLNSGFRPTAVICVNDYTAIGVLSELRERSFDVPRDVSVTGFDNIQLSEYCYPPLTTAHIPRDRIGHLVFQALVPEPGAQDLTGREIVVEPELILRQSSARALNV